MTQITRGAGSVPPIAEDFLTKGLSGVLGPDLLQGASQSSLHQLDAYLRSLPYGGLQQVLEDLLTSAGTMQQAPNPDAQVAAFLQVAQQSAQQHGVQPGPLGAANSPAVNLLPKDQQAAVAAPPPAGPPSPSQQPQQQLATQQPGPIQQLQLPPSNTGDPNATLTQAQMDYASQILGVDFTTWYTDWAQHNALALATLDEQGNILGTQPWTTPTLTTLTTGQGTTGTVPTAPQGQTATSTTGAMAPGAFSSFQQLVAQPDTLGGPAGPSWIGGDVGPLQNNKPPATPTKQDAYYYLLHSTFGAAGLMAQAAADEYQAKNGSPMPAALRQQITQALQDPTNKDTVAQYLAAFQAKNVLAPPKLPVLVENMLTEWEANHPLQSANDLSAAQSLLQRRDSLIAQIQKDLGPGVVPDASTLDTLVRGTQQDFTDWERRQPYRGMTYGTYQDTLQNIGSMWQQTFGTQPDDKAIRYAAGKSQQDIQTWVNGLPSKLAPDINVGRYNALSQLVDTVSNQFFGGPADPSMVVNVGQALQ